MATQTVPIHRTNGTTKNTDNKSDISFNPFDYAPGQDGHIRWLSRPNQQLIRNKYAHDIEKFRITFDVENFQPEQIKIYIQNRKLTISGVYEERSENRTMQKQFERNFDIPAGADVEAMASFITPSHMLVVEIPVNSSVQTDHLNINNVQNDLRRLSFSLNKFNELNNQGLLSKSNELSSSEIPGQQVRRTSVSTTTKTTTTTTGSSELPPEAAALLRNADLTNGTSIQTFRTHTTERRASNTDNQPIAINQSNASPSSSLTTTSSDLKNLPLQIPPELFTRGGTITIQTRRVSITKEANGNTGQPVSVPITHNTDTKSTSSTTTTSNVSSNALNQQGTASSDSCNSKNERRMYTLEEFLQNKTWNPSLIDGPDGKKILYMRLQMKPGTTLDQMKISLNGFDLRIEVNKKLLNEGGQSMNEQSYHQITLFPTCEVDQLKTELKADGFLHIKVPIKL